MPPVVFLALAAGAAGLASVGAIASIAIFGTTVGALLVNLAISFALSGILGLLAGQSAPRPAQQKQNIKQAIGPRRRSYGRLKLGGVYAFLNNRQSNLYVVLMITQGEIDAFEQHYLGADLLTVSGGGDVTVPAQYVLGSTSYVNIVGYVGSDTQTADSVLTTAWSDVLDSNFRLRGIAYSRLRLLSPKPEDFTKVYPSGLPEYNAVIRGAKVWDPRDGGQDPDDPTTWTWTQNAALIILDYLWHDDGMRLPRALIEPAIETWKLQADACDDARTLLDTSTEDWYRLSGQYQLTDAPKQVLPLMLDPIDGRLGMRPDGAIILDVGQWQPPDTTISDRDIYSYSMTRGRQQSDVRNEIRAQYVAPENSYIAAEAQPYQNTASIDVDGLQSMTMDLSWSPSHAQARYRMKIEAGRHDASRWNGQVVTNAYGMKFLCQRGDGTRKRTIHLEIVELGIDDDFEVQRFGFDVKTGRCTFSVTQMSFADYSWDAATDEGTAPATGEIPDADTVEVPSNLTPTVEDAVITGGLVVKFISATVDAPTQANLTLDLAYRVHDGGVTDDDAVWTQFTLDGNLIGHTGTLPDGGIYDVRARFINPQGQLSTDVFERSVTIAYDPSLPPSSPFVAPTLRSSASQSSSASSYTINFPSGATAGDVCVLFGAHGFNFNSPSGWTVLNLQNSVSTWSGACWVKQLTAGDISTGSVAVTTLGSFNGVFVIACFDGGVGDWRPVVVSVNTSGASTRSLDSPFATSTTDYVFFCGMNRGADNVTCDKGSQLQQLNATNASGALYGLVPGSNGSITATFSYPVTTSGDYQIIVAFKAPGS